MKAKYSNPKTEKDIFDKATMYSCVAFAMVLRDKFAFGTNATQKAVKEINYLIDSIIKGYVSFDDLEKELEKDGIHFN